MYTFDYLFKVPAQWGRFRFQAAADKDRPTVTGASTALEEMEEKSPFPMESPPVPAQRPRASSNAPLDGDAGWLLSPGNARLIRLQILSLKFI